MENRLYNSNNRAVINEFGVVRQVTNFYPFGGVFSTTAYNRGDDLQPYKYNGKELDRTHGLDWYDYGARNYDAIVPGFTKIDPHCEKYYNKSPYVYGKDNPIRYVDPNGKDDWDKVVGFVYGIVTDVIPGTDDLRDSYTPSNYADYNTGLQNADKTSNVVGAALVVDGGKDVATGLSVASTSATVMVASGGTTAPVTGTTAVGVLTLAAKGGLEMGVGAVMLANTSKNSSKGYDRGRGTPVESKTLWNSKGMDKMRIDVENPRAREGQIHCHDGKNKYYYNFREKKFTSAPGKVNELLKRKDVQEAIKKGEQYLGL